MWGQITVRYGSLSSVLDRGSTSLINPNFRNNFLWTRAEFITTEHFLRRKYLSLFLTLNQQGQHDWVIGKRGLKWIDDEMLDVHGINVSSGSAQQWTSSSNDFYPLSNVFLPLGHKKKTVVYDSVRNTYLWVIFACPCIETARDKLRIGNWRVQVHIWNNSHSNFHSQKAERKRRLQCTSEQRFTYTVQCTFHFCQTASVPSCLFRR